ncbi:MAG: CoA-transferase [Terriglobia bacterium]
MNKIFPSIQQALADLSDGAVLMVGGMNEKGVPQTLLRAVSLKATRNLTVVSHDLGNHGRGVRILFEQHQVKKLISSSLGEDSL